MRTGTTYERIYIENSPMIQTTKLARSRSPASVLTGRSLSSSVTVNWQVVLAFRSLSSSVAINWHRRVLPIDQVVHSRLGFRRLHFQLVLALLTVYKSDGSGPVRLIFYGVEYLTIYRDTTFFRTPPLNLRTVKFWSLLEYTAPSCRRNIMDL